MPQFSRRGFLQAGSVTALGTLAAGGRHLALAAEAPTPQAASEVPPTDPVRYASIGVGIQGSSLLRAAVTLPEGKCVAACDLYDGRHTLAREIAGQGIRTTRRYHEILESKDVEAVIVAVPDFWHSTIAIDALKAGKDVYCEKPMSHTIPEGASMVEAVHASSGKFIQVGSQRVSSALFLKAKALFDAGAIGNFQQVELQLGRNSPGGAWQYPPPSDLSLETLDWNTWLRNTPKKPLDPIAFARWRAFHAYGTGMAGDLMVHLLSGMQFTTGLNAVPDEAFTVADIVRWPDGRDMPDVQFTAFRYGKIPVSVRLTLGTETPEITRIMGSHGIIEVTDNSVILTPQLGVDRSPDYGLNGYPAALHAAYEKQWHAEHDAFLEEHPLDERTVWKGTSWDDLHPHLRNFFNSVRTRKPPVEDVTFGYHAAAACHMANLSYFEKRLIKGSEFTKGKA